MLDVYSKPLFFFDAVIAAAAVVLALAVLMAILRRNDPRRLASLEGRVDLLLPMGLVVMFITLLHQFIGFNYALTSILSSGTGDPRILFVGVLEAFLPLFMFLMIGIVILLAWFVLRAALRKKVSRLESGGV